MIFGGQTQTWTFDRSVSLRFSLRGLTGPGECMQVPPGSVLVSLAPSHSYNPTTRLVCYTANVPTADSFFTLSPTTSRVLVAVSHPELGRGPGSIEVTFTEEPALSIVKSSATGSQVMRSRMGPMLQPAFQSSSANKIQTPAAAASRRTPTRMIRSRQMRPKNRNGRASTIGRTASQRNHVNLEGVELLVVANRPTPQT